MSDSTFGFLLMVPALLVLLVVIAFPILKGIYASFCDYGLKELRKGIFDLKWNNFANYKIMLQNNQIFSYFKNTFVFVALVVVIQLILGMGIALLLDSKIKARGTLRGLMLVPWTIPSVVTAIVWRFMTNSSYGVINSIWWAGNATDGSGVAKANVTYMDGTTAQVDISKMTYVHTTPATPATPATKTVKSGDVTHSTGINALVMKADDQNKYFYVDTYINTNKVADTNGILNGHLFQFTTKSNGTLDAVEVATGTAAKLYNLADVAVSKNTQVYGGATGTLVVNSNTVFLVRSGADTTANPYTFKSITGFTNIDNYAKGEVDYVDLNGDNVADYVYVIAPTTTSKVTSLFYFDGQQGAYTLADGTWVVKGYVDGVAGEVKFANFDALQNTLKISGQTGYPVNNTLYVVTLEDGVVKSGHIVTDGEQLKGYANYPLSSAYNTYSDITINIVEGAAGTVANNYSDRDTFADSLYHDYSANKYYSVVTDLTKVVGTMGNPADQNYYFVSIQNNGQLNALALQAYAYDKVKSGVDVPNAATVIGVALNANKDATVSLNANNDAKKGDVYSVTLEQLRDNGYVTVGTFSGTVVSDGATSVTIDLRGVIGAGTYKVTAGSYSSIMSFAN